MQIDRLVVFGFGLWLCAVLVSADDTVVFAGKRMTRPEADAIQADSTADANGAAESQRFGARDESVYNIDPHEFQVRYGKYAAASFYSHEVGVADGHTTVDLAAPIRLPAGALIKSVTVFFYDDTQAANLSHGIWRASGTGFGTLVQSLDRSTPFFGGYASETTTLSAPHVVDNFNNHYHYLLSLQRSGDEEQKIIRVQIKYQPQIGAAATRTDDKE